jgi:hypothetical protein
MRFLKILKRGASSAAFYDAVRYIDLATGRKERWTSAFLIHQHMTLNNILKWTGFLAVVLGAAFTSLRIDPLNIYFLNLGAALCLIWSIRIREWNLVIVNGVLLAIYIFGLLWTSYLDMPVDFFRNAS